MIKLFKCKLDNQSGITMISLVITIVLMLIIASTSVYTSINRFEINNYKKMKNDIELLSEKVSNYYLKYSALPIERDTENNPIEYTYTALEFEKNKKDNENYYILDLQAMGGLSLNYGEEGYKNLNSSEDVYIINEQSCTIYYVKGIEMDDVVYYTIQNGKSTLNDIIPPSKPQIKVVTGESVGNNTYTSNVVIEIVPGKDSSSDIKKTTYSINNGTETDITTLTNNIIEITEEGTYEIKVWTYDVNDNSSSDSTTIIISELPNKQ